MDEELFLCDVINVCFYAGPSKRHQVSFSSQTSRGVVYNMLDTLHEPIEIKCLITPQNLVHRRYTARLNVYYRCDKVRQMVIDRSSNVGTATFEYLSS